MINSLYIKSVLITLLIIGCLSHSSLSQTVQFSMDVRPELGIEVLQDLNFGTVIANSGKQRVSLGDAQMGIFKIKALAAQNALLTLTKPESLLATQQGSEDNIPVNIQAVYSSRPTGFNDVVNFSDNTLWISLGNGTTDALSPTWETGYVLVYGDIEVGEVTEGSYSGTLLLNVTYQ